ncbi:hypothetical protein [Shewanella sp. UCD-KL12]|uniref:hypothetical protein n=1 Tax=Shewanella sp. UCD-KL12 TaxID=1917163 RepID=UPI0015C34DA1|nr:hypothetical protein [Shewanella sp. UCD-KL12]
MEINFTLNYQAQSLEIEPMHSLLKTLRDAIGLKTKQEDVGEGDSDCFGGHHAD